MRLAAGGPPKVLDSWKNRGYHRNINPKLAKGCALCEVALAVGWLVDWNRQTASKSGSTIAVANSTETSYSPPVRLQRGQYELPVSPYERVASLVIALLILVGLAVGIMFLLWLTSRIFTSQAAVPVTLEPIGEGGGFADATELDPNVETVGQEIEFEEPEFQDTLATIADAVATKAALLETPTFDHQTGTAKGGPLGDGRAPGFGPGKPGKPRHWEVVFLEGNTISTYARQLDYFKVELGVLMPGNRVEYVKNLSNAKPDRSSGAADAEQRYYLTWQKGGLREADLELLAKAGVDPGNRPILKFIPPELEAHLVQLERQRAGKNADKVRATYFAIREQGGGYEFYVRDQTYKY